MRTHPVARLHILACGALLAAATAVAAPPVITQQPANVVATSGTAATFSVTATAAGSLSYQWRHLGAPVANGTGPSLTLNAVTMADAGLYDVVVTADGESTTSQAGRLITTPTQYADQFCLDDSFLPLIEITGASAQSVAADPITGGFYVGGEFSTIDGVRRWNLARFDAEGNIDASFAPQVDGNVLTIAVQPDGKVLIGGAFRFVNNVQRGGIARLNTDGSLDRTFGNNRGFAGTVTCIGLQSTGRIVVCGPTSYDNLPAFQYTTLLRLLPTGSPDPTFNAANSPTHGWFVVDSKDRILLQPNWWDGSLVRLSPNGAKDPLFTAPDDMGEIDSLALQSDGRLIELDLGRVRRLQEDGGPDPSFRYSPPSSTHTTAPAIVSVDAADNILVAIDNKMARLKPDGAKDDTFSVEMGAEKCVTTIPNGRIIVVGQTPSGIKLFNTDGATERFASDSFAKPSATIVAAIPSTNSSTLIAGRFSRVDGLPRNGIARILSDGTADPDFVPPSSDCAIAAIACQGDGKILISRANSDVSLERLFADGSKDYGFFAQYGPIDSPTGLAVQADGRILSGGDRVIRRYDTTGALDASFAPAPASTAGKIHLILPQTDGSFLVGGSRYFEWAAALCRLLPNGAVDPAFQIWWDSTFSYGTDILAGCQQPDGSLVVGGIFTDRNSDPVYGFAWLNTDGSLVRGGAWEEIGSSLVCSVLWQPDGRIVVSGDFTRDYGANHNALVRLNTDGTRSNAFNVANAEASATSTVQFDDTGRILYSGAFSSRCGLVQTGLTRLKPGAAPEPRIIHPPNNSHFLPGSSATLRIQADGSDLHYRWYKNGVAVPASDSATLTIPAAASSDSGRYHAEAFNTFGAVLSTGADLVVTPETQIEYYEWANANGLTDPNDWDQSPESDPEGDGVPNLLHYAFKTPRGSSQGTELHVCTEHIDGSDFLGIQFTRKTYATDLSYIVESSSDLVTWETVETLTAGLPEQVTVHDKLPIRTGDRRFLRIRVKHVTPLIYPRPSGISTDIVGPSL